MTPTPKTSSTAQATVKKDLTLTDTLTTSSEREATRPSKKEKENKTPPKAPETTIIDEFEDDDIDLLEALAATEAADKATLTVEIETK